jgi:hypothetical protein
MHNARDNRTLYSFLQGRQGQSLVLALMILFMLVFIGGLFVTLVVKNMGRAARSGQTMSADYLAETGVRYASDQLTYSLDGADWRPVPEDADMVIWWELHHKDVPMPPTPTGTGFPLPDDPDYQWLKQGFCRFTYGGGRFLVRVSYDPRYGDPVSKYIKIESIGRVGVVDRSDPTTLQLKQPERMRVEKIAYKAIGITDYSRFVTNLDHRTEPFGLGVPAYTLPDGKKKAFVTQYGDVSDINGDGAPEMHGGSIRVNGNLTWYGANYLWLDRDLNEAVEVAGDITHAIDWNRAGNQIPPDATAVYVNPNLGDANFAKNPTRQSSDPLFDTSPDVPLVDVGVYRDGRPEPDIGATAPGPVHFTRPRSIQRLDPPLIDINGPAGGAGRYRELTRNSGDWKQDSTGTWYNTGYYGWGKGVYINNKDDIQSESELRTLRDDWMNPGGSQYWAGPYYTPPGVVIVLTPYDLDNADGDNHIMTNPDMIIMQTNVSGAKYNWYDATGNILTPAAGQMIMPYPENGVIFAEGNIRIKGTLPPGKQLTVVSGGTIYVEGNILKANVDENNNPLQPTDPRNSGISLLANDNVCVNTTQFFGPAPESQTSGCWRPDISCYAASVDHPLTFNFAFGQNPTQWYTDDGGNQLPVGVYVRHTADNGPSYMTMAINQTGAGASATAPGDVWFGLYQFGLGPWCTPTPPSLSPARSYIYPLADPEAVASFDPTGIGAVLQSHVLAEQKYPMWEHQVFTLLPLQLQGKSFEQKYALNVFPGANNLITFGLDQNLAKSDYLLSRIAVQPSDIRIEALMYAQNGSFYVIPGEWFNPDSGDTREKVKASGSTREIATARCRVDIRSPYFGDPLDVLVTIYGAISENIPAPVADEAAWMDKWGWIPSMHGESRDAQNITTSYRSPLDPRDDEHDIEQNGTDMIRQRGLSIIYDNQLSYPKVPNADSAKAHDRTYDVPVRWDAYSRPLPITPKLPVSAQTLFFGTPT